jgi:hypothetical protein
MDSHVSISYSITNWDWLDKGKWDISFGLNQDSGVHLLLQQSLGKHSSFSKPFCKKGNSIQRRDEQFELHSPWASYWGFAVALPGCPKFPTLPVVTGPSGSGEWGRDRKPCSVGGWYLVVSLLIHQPSLGISGLLKTQWNYSLWFSFERTSFRS